MPGPTMFVLVGGEAHELQGKPSPQQREFLHTSVSFIGTAYEQLRAVGVPRARIITIVQLRDYLDTLAAGEAAAAIGESSIPGHYWTDQRARTERACRRLIDEGGADYDCEDVNPATVTRVLLGEATARISKCVDASSDSPVFFSIYTHGDFHTAIARKRDDEEGCAARPPSTAPPNERTHEWFAHMPYRVPLSDQHMYDHVATDGASGDATTYLYSTQLRSIYVKMMQQQPTRPVVGLLNFCFAGGSLEFMRRPWVQRELGVSEWPLFLCASSSGAQESLVAGLWDSWFYALRRAALGGEAMSLGALFRAAAADYHSSNIYELANEVKSRVYAPSVFANEFVAPGSCGHTGSWDPWHVDLKLALLELPSNASAVAAGASGESGVGNSACARSGWMKLQELHEDYEGGRAFRLLDEHTAATPAGASLAAELRDIGGVACTREGGLLVWMHGDAGRLLCSEYHGDGASRMDLTKPHAVQLVAYSGTTETGRIRAVDRGLVRIVELSRQKAATPEAVWGAHSGVESMDVVAMLSGM